MDPRLLVLIFLLISPSWLVPFVKGLQHLNRSQNEEAIGNDSRTGDKQKNHFVRYALNDLKKSQKYFIISWVVLSVEFFATVEIALFL